MKKNKKKKRKRALSLPEKKKNKKKKGLCYFFYTIAGKKGELDLSSPTELSKNEKPDIPLSTPRGRKRGQGKKKDRQRCPPTQKKKWKGKKKERAPGTPLSWSAGEKEGDAPARTPVGGERKKEGKKGKHALATAERNRKVGASLFSFQGKT